MCEPDEHTEDDNEQDVEIGRQIPGKTLRDDRGRARGGNHADGLKELLGHKPCGGHDHPKSDEHAHSERSAIDTSVHKEQRQCNHVGEEKGNDTAE